MLKNAPRGAFILLQLTALAIVGTYPPLVNYLPNRVSFLSETSPPPRNPRLQMCLEDYVGQKLSESTETQDAIAAMRALDLSILPEDLADDLTDGLQSADTAIAELEAAFAAAGEVEAAADAYRPQLRVVRGIEKQIRNVTEEIDKLETRIGRMRGEEQAEARTALEADAATLRAEADHLRAQIPESWTEVHEAFQALTTAENSARTRYRRAADSAYDDSVDVLAVLEANDDFLAMGAQLRDLGTTIQTAPQAEAENLVGELSDAFGDIEGADDVEDALDDAAKALNASDTDRTDAIEAYATAVAAFDAQAAWRQQADASLRPGLAAYVDTIRGTLGIRVQDRFTREQALAMASCSSRHRDISLNF